MTKNRGRKNYLTSIRIQARQLYLQSLDSPYSYCGWCGEMLVWAKKLPDNVFVEMVGERSALIRESGLSKLIRIGTVDHIVRIADGGTNELSNLAGLCVECHRNKDQLTKEGEARYCRICMKPLEETDFRRIHTQCQRDEPFLTYKLGERFQT